MIRTIPHIEKAENSSDAPAPVQTARNFVARHPMKLTVLPPLQKKIRGEWVVVNRLQVSPDVDPPPTVSGKKQPSAQQAKELVEMWASEVASFKSLLLPYASAEELLELASLRQIKEAILLFKDAWRTRSASLADRISQIENYCLHTPEVNI
jgi:hypothetical protein